MAGYKFTLTEVARILRRSETSLLRDIEAGSFKVADRGTRRRRGGANVTYTITLKDLEGYLGRDKAQELFAGKVKPTVIVTEHLVIDGAAKRCRTCGLLKPVGAFARDARYNDGMLPDCKDCLRKIFGAR